MIGKIWKIWLNMENITNANDAHTKGVCKDFEIKKLGKYLDLHIQSELYC